MTNPVVLTPRTGIYSPTIGSNQGLSSGVLVHKYNAKVSGICIDIG